MSNPERRSASNSESVEDLGQVTFYGNNPDFPNIYISKPEGGGLTVGYDVKRGVFFGTITNESGMNLLVESGDLTEEQKTILRKKAAEHEIIIP